MAVDKKISQLTSLAQVDVVTTTDVLPIVDTSVTETKKITVGALVGAGAAAGLTGVDINSGSIDGTAIGASSASTGAFTTFSASGAVTLNPANAAVSLAPTGTGVVTINPATAGTMNNVAIGGSTAAAGTFTTVTGTSVVNALGAVGTPSYTFTGDLNTGMWSPTADTVAWSTGGSERMRLDTSGNLSLGASSLGFRCQISGDATNTLPTSWGQLVITGTNTAKQLMIGYDTTNDYGFLQATLVGTAYKNLVLQSGGGNVGIGTTTASFKITNNFDAPATWGNNANNFIEMWQNQGTNALGVAMGDDSLVSLTTNNGYSLLFATSGTERMRIDSSTGNVGIGTATSSTKLDVQGARWTVSSGYQGVAFLKSTDAQAADVGAGLILGGKYDGTNITEFAQVAGVKENSTSGNYAGAMLFYTRANGLSALYERMRIDSSGNVGIGGTAQAFSRCNVTGTLPTSSQTSAGFLQSGTVPSGTTNSAYGCTNNLITQAASFTLSNYYHFFAYQNTIGAGSSITNQYGYFVDGGLTGATNNFGFYSNIASGSNRWNFYAAGTARNYFAGQTGIGTTTDNGRLSVQGSGTTSATNAASFKNDAGSNIVYFRDDRQIFADGISSGAGTYALKWQSSGQFTYDTSSARYKDNIRDSKYGLDAVLKLKPRMFEYKNDGRTDVGLIAEEVDLVVPELAPKDAEGRPDAVSYDRMVSVLIKAIQELSAKVAALEAK